VVNAKPHLFQHSLLKIAKHIAVGAAAEEPSKLSEPTVYKNFQKTTQPVSVSNVTKE
jgi:hypothetical protein